MTDKIRLFHDEDGTLHCQPIPDENPSTGNSGPAPSMTFEDLKKNLSEFRQRADQARPRTMIDYLRRRNRLIPKRENFVQRLSYRTAKWWLLKRRTKFTARFLYSLGSMLFPVCGISADIGRAYNRAMRNMVRCHRIYTKTAPFSQSLPKIGDFIVEEDQLVRWGNRRKP